MTQPCSTGGAQDGGEHEGDLDALEDLAEKFGLPVTDCRASDLFREPDKIKRAVEETRRRERDRDGKKRGKQDREGKEQKGAQAPAGS